MEINSRTEHPVGHSRTPFDWWLLDCIILLLPTYLLRFQIGPIGLNVLDCVIAVAFIICVARSRSLPVKSLSTYWKWSMLAWLGIGMIATIVSPNWLAAVGLFKSYIVAPMLVGAMVLVIKPPLRHLIKTFALLVSYIAVVAIVQYVTGLGIPAPWNTAGSEFRVTSVFEYPNAVGLLLTPLIALLVAYSVHDRRSWWLVVSILLGIMALIGSRSDGGIVAVIIAVICTLLFTRWRWLALGALVIGVSAALAFQPTRDVLLLHDTSGEVRRVLWHGTWNLLKDRPVVGAGLAGFSTLYAQYKLDRHVELLLYPHNIFLDFWVELGILGLLWLLIQLGYFFKKLFETIRREYSPPAIVIMTTMIAILIYGLVDVPYFKNDLAVLFWIILTLSSSAYQRAPMTSTEKK